MATKRMFSNCVIDSDAFCMLSTNAQLLYFHLGMKADDDGFVSVMKICRILGFDKKPLEELEEAGFLIPFDDGVVAIVHWFVNNTIKRDRYHESRYTSHKKRLKLDENGEYSLMETERNQNGTESDASIAQYSPAQVSVAYGSPAQVNPGEGSCEGGTPFVLDPEIETVLNKHLHGKINDNVRRLIIEQLNNRTKEEMRDMLSSESGFLVKLQTAAVRG